MNVDDEFYVGYLPLPPRLGRSAALAAGMLPLLAGLIAVALGAAQATQPSGRFEFGTRRTFEGLLLDSPLPLLRVEHDGGGVTAYLLVGRGKRGLPAFAANHAGERVRFDGSLIHRENVTMIEMNDRATFTVLDAAPAADRGEFERLGALTVIGELVDTKCFLGVMRPATGKVHRACAIRCLSGGIPPGLLVRHPGGRSTLMLLAGVPGAPLDLDLEQAGTELWIRGTLERHDDLPVLRVIESRPARARG